MKNEEDIILEPASMGRRFVNYMLDMLVILVFGYLFGIFLAFINLTILI